MAHYKATIEYDGSDFHGFQRQAAARSVQGVLEETLARLQGGEPIAVRGAGGRTAGSMPQGKSSIFICDGETMRRGCFAR